MCACWLTPGDNFCVGFVSSPQGGFEEVSDPGTLNLVSSE
jgi:hypothetical protein